MATQQVDLGFLLRIIIQLLKILFFGPNTAQRLSWLRDALSAVLHLAGTFPEKFPYETRREIEEKLREANLCEQSDEMRDKWKPQQDWEVIIKLALELVLQLVHDWSPKPDPPTPPPPPETDLAKHVRDWVKANVKDPNMKPQAKRLAIDIAKGVAQISRSPKEKTPDSARETMRQVATNSIGGAHAEWLAFSGIIDAYLDDLAVARRGLGVKDLLTLWTKISQGLEAASR